MKLAEQVLKMHEKSHKRNPEKPIKGSSVSIDLNDETGDIQFSIVDNDRSEYWWDSFKSAKAAKSFVDKYDLKVTSVTNTIYKYGNTKLDTIEKFDKELNSVNWKS